MGLSDILTDSNVDKILNVWDKMGDIDKAHFINQVAIALSIWGRDKNGKRLVVEILQIMAEDGTATLADFGLYIDKTFYKKRTSALADKIREASLIIEGYRVKNALSSEPHISLV
jgi:hypothetical protein